MLHSNDRQSYVDFPAEKGAHRIVREILLAALLGIVMLYALLSPFGEVSVIATIIGGPPFGLLLWLIYRIVRFAVFD